jgi:hypothetical protein
MTPFACAKRLRKKMMIDSTADFLEQIKSLPKNLGGFAPLR